MILVVDNSFGDKIAFVPHLLRYLRDRGVAHRVVKTLAQYGRVDPAEVTGVILTGSPRMMTAADMGKYPEQFVLNIRALEDYGVPVLGICFGCQFINQYYGGKLARLRSLFCKDADLVSTNTSLPLPVRFCINYVIAEVPPTFDVLGTSTIRGHRNTPTFMKHKSQPVLGCLFHPEVHAVSQRAILDGFLCLCMPKR
jgi:GMP synthase-like glutamine amidotransferase